MFCAMLNVGEESGNMDEILQKTAAFYDEEAQAAITYDSGASSITVSGGTMVTGTIFMGRHRMRACACRRRSALQRILEEMDRMDTYPYLEVSARAPQTMESAVAVIAGGPAYAQVRGRVRFTQRPDGVAVEAHIQGLPRTPTGFFAFHLHEGVCGNPGNDPAAYFPQTGGHYNPNGEAHPMHAGDFPSLLETGTGAAYLNFLTSRFTVRQIIGRSVVIHLDPDDFHTQPSGNAGPKIACGVVASRPTGRA